MTRPLHSTLRGALPWLAAGALISGLSACSHAPDASTQAQTQVQTMQLTTAQERGSAPGGDEHFTGETTVSMLFMPNGPRRSSAGTVTFQPGARTAWHTHPGGQTLVVTEGLGWIKIEGEPRRDITPGDVVWIPPNKRHWHGASADSAMTHIAHQELIDGSVVDWLEKVSDDQYLTP